MRILSSTGIEVTARHLVERRKELGIEFLSSVTVSRGRRHDKDLAQCREAFVARVLKTEFVSA